MLAPPKRTSSWRSAFFHSAAIARSCAEVKPSRSLSATRRHCIDSVVRRADRSRDADLFVGESRFAAQFIRDRIEDDAAVGDIVERLVRLRRIARELENR